MFKSILLLLVACSPAPDSKGGCLTTLQGTSPADGEQNVSTRTSVVLTLDPPEAAAEPTLYNEAGEPVPSTSSLQDGDYVLIPDEELASASTYHVVINTCEKTQESISFTTSVLSSALTGQVWYLQALDNNEFALIEALHLGDPAQFGLLVEFGEVGDHQINLRLAPAQDDGARADTCSPTLDVVAAENADTATLTAGTTATPVWFHGSAGPTYLRSLVIDHLNADGAPAGTTLNIELQLEPYLDQLGTLLGTSDPDELCSLLVSFGAECTACEAISDPYCLQLPLSLSTIGPSASGALSCVDEVACHPDCATSTCDDPAQGECN